VAVSVLKATKPKTRRFLLIALPLLVAGALLGGVGLARPGGAQPKTLLPPFEFQLNGREPYTIQLQLTRGERLTCLANASYAPVTLVMAFREVVLRSSTFTGSYRGGLQAGSSGTYVLEFESSSPAVVWMSLYSS
jgi:hypothetical protein